MVNAILKLLNLFNLSNDKNSNNNISPNESNLNIINNKKTLVKIMLILITGLSHGFVIGAISYLI